MSRINIVPTDVVVNSIISFTIEVTNVRLFNSASIRVGLWDSKYGIIVSEKCIDISGQEYVNWNNNDEYIINLVAEKMGFTLLTSPTNPSSIVPTPELSS